MRFLVVLLLSIGAAISARADNILFVGNSLTGFNNTPGVFQGLAEAQGLRPSVFASIKFGQTLAVQLADPQVRAFVSSHKWDSVVLQEYSSGPLEHPDEFQKGVLEFSALVPGANVFLFQNWPYSDANSSVIAKLDAVYARVSKASGATVIHLGRAINYLSRRTEIGVYSDDRHPEPIASYLCAVMMLDAVYGLSPVSLAPRGSATHTADVMLGPATAPVWIDLNPDDAALVQQTAVRYK